jgi:hypothetical protein
VWPQSLMAWPYIFQTGVEDRMVVGIEDVLLEFRVASNVNLADPMMRDVVQVLVRIEAMVVRY